MLAINVVDTAMLDAAGDKEAAPSPALQTNGVGPGMVYVISVIASDVFSCRIGDGP